MGMLLQNSYGMWASIFFGNLSKKMEKPNVKHEALPAQLSLPLTIDKIQVQCMEPWLEITTLRYTIPWKDKS